MNIYTVMYSLGIRVEASVIQNHDEALAAWRAGRLPTVDPPASPSETYVTTLRMTRGEALRAYHALGVWLVANPRPELDIET